LAAADRPAAPGRLAIVGATASGKSGIALALADALRGEIVGADSRQIYRGLEIGSAAPSAADRARAPHHLVAFLDPAETYSAGRFAREARAVIAGIESRGHTAVIAGGSGLYLRALVEGLFEGPERDDRLRARLHERWRREGLEALREELGRVDPEALAGILPGDPVRVIRALEVYELTGRPISALRRERPAPRLDVSVFGLRWQRGLLATRIQARVRAQLDAGFLEEARRLRARGLPPDAPGPRTLGHAQLLAHLRGECGLEEAVAEIVRRTRQLAKRQETWFRKVEGIEWVDVASGADLAEAARRIAERWRERSGALGP
jgi:tRNA dimethylallyltransferase